MSGQITPLDLAWEAVNSLGGVPRTMADADYCRAINDALDRIEALGGEDPAPKRAKIAEAALAKECTDAAIDEAEHLGGKWEWKQPATTEAS